MISKPSITYILIACCTCKRPIMLEKSLNSVRNLVLPENVKIELLVIDNDKDASAKPVINKLQLDFPFKINYFIEEERGISKARNKLLNESVTLSASHIALFDDDEVLDTNWLLAHVNQYQNNPDAIIISGPTYNKFEENFPTYITKNNIFKSTTTKKTGLVRSHCASGNVFFPTNIMTDASIYFDESHVFMGGEDGDFFSRASQTGFTIVWNNEALNYEIIGKERGNLKWILSRYYYNGYSSAHLKLRSNTSLTYRLLYIIKNSIILFLNLLLASLSVFFGPTIFFNAIGILCKTKGKLDSAIKHKPINYYENICGN